MSPCTTLWGGYDDIHGHIPRCFMNCSLINALSHMFSVVSLFLLFFLILLRMYQQRLSVQYNATCYYCKCATV